MCRFARGPTRRFPTFRKESCMRSPRAGMVGIEYHRALSGISHGEGAIVASAASGPHALWRGGGRGVIRRGVAGSVPVPECRGRGRRAGAEAAFAALVARHGPMVLGVCRCALPDPNDVEDAFQATFLVLVRRARSVRVGDSLGRWLYGVARRVAAKAQARSERARIRSLPLGREPVASEPPADRIELLAALDEEVSRLPEKYLAPVVLCDLEGLTHAQAAARLRWPVGTVSGRLSRARDLLKNRNRSTVPPRSPWPSRSPRSARGQTGWRTARSGLARARR